MTQSHSLFTLSASRQKIAGGFICIFILLAAARFPEKSPADTRNFFQADTSLGHSSHNKKKVFHPLHPFTLRDVPAPPVYSSRSGWAALPEMKDAADTVPVSFLRDEQATAQADVFFIHPTTWNSDLNWNGDIADEKLNRNTDETAIRHQATVFNGSCRVYAPRYRQMTLGGFFCEESINRDPALAIAWEDVKSAFEYYLRYYNQGRPIVIASHSQGTVHAMALLREYFDGKPLQKQLVAAYIPGWAIRKETFTVLKPCNEPGQTGCFVTWSTYAWKYELQPNWFADAWCVNPITWKTDGEASYESEHKGLVLRNFNSVKPELVSAQAHNGYLWVTKPDLPGKFLLRTKNYHIADYNIFWMDVRENARLRVKNFVEAAGK